MKSLVLWGCTVSGFCIAIILILNSTSLCGITCFSRQLNMPVLRYFVAIRAITSLTSSTKTLISVKKSPHTWVNFPVRIFFFFTPTWTFIRPISLPLLAFLVGSTCNMSGDRREMHMLQLDQSHYKRRILSPFLAIENRDVFATPPPAPVLYCMHVS